MEDGGWRMEDGGWSKETTRDAQINKRQAVKQTWKIILNKHITILCQFANERHTLWFANVDRYTLLVAIDAHEVGTLTTLKWRTPRCND